MASVTLDRIEKRWPDGTAAVRPFELEVADGEFMVLVGPSGCGKTTLLRMIAGLTAVSAGRVLLDGRDVTACAPAVRNVAMVFQNYALYPHMTVRGNLEFPLRMARRARPARRRRVEETAELLGLTELLGRRPAELSGGQRQRVAMGRALVRQPAVFLMDEPLSNLDAKLRVQIRTEIAALTRRVGTTTIYVTHDQVEAMTLGDRIAVIAGGELQQNGAPQDLYDRPVNAFVARFLGNPGMNVLPIEAVTESGAVVAGQLLELEQVPAGAAALGIRPEAVAAVTGHGAGSILEGTVQAVEALGHEGLVHVDPGLVARLPLAAVPAVGDRIRLRLDPAAVFYFDARGDALPRRAALRGA